MKEARLLLPWLLPQYIRRCIIHWVTCTWAGEKFKKRLLETTMAKMSRGHGKAVLNSRMKDELARQALGHQYWINTMMTTNGQSPFVTLFHAPGSQGQIYIEEKATPNHQKKS